METIYDKDYFIKKFEAIPDEDIGKGRLDKHCALHHCGVHINGRGEYVETVEARKLAKLFGSNELPIIHKINDGTYYFDPKVGKNIIAEGNTPKERILNKLRSL